MKLKRSFKSPSLAQNFSEIFSFRMEKLKILCTLIESDWAIELSTEAEQNLALNKFNRPPLIPFAEDILVKIILEWKLETILYKILSRISKLNRRNIL